jgi:hypothetical protein
MSMLSIFVHNPSHSGFQLILSVQAAGDYASASFAPCVGLAGAVTIFCFVKARKAAVETARDERGRE